MTARFIFSLDCEGKWGVADHLDGSVHASLTEKRLRAAYASLVDLLDRYEVEATFAFVGLFAEGDDKVRRLSPLLDDFAADFPGYLGAALTDWRDGSRDGWCGDWAVERVLGAKANHEIAFHGVTHIPWDRMDQDALAKELALYEALSSPVASSRTMVFPRNRVAHTGHLREIGLVGYRAGIHRSRAASLIGEFNPFVAPEPPLPPAVPVVIPAGFFVNWQHGARRLVPRALSRFRAQNLIARAQGRGAVVHFWLHPENLASAPATLGRVEDIIALVARERDAGRCVVHTQSGYCDWVTQHTMAAADRSPSRVGGVAA